MAYEARYVFKLHAGADLKAAVSAMQQGAALWRKHGAAAPRLWAITAGELGNYVLAVQFDDAAGFAKVVDSLSADADFQAWQARNAKDGHIAWVRSNHAREVTLT